MERAEIIRAREEEVARQWEWLQETINLVARAKADQKDADAFRLLQHHFMDVGQRRVELMTKLATADRIESWPTSTGTGDPITLTTRLGSMAVLATGQVQERSSPAKVGT